MFQLDFDCDCYDFILNQKHTLKKQIASVLRVRSYLFLVQKGNATTFDLCKM